MRLLTLAVALALLSGCSDESKMTSACKGLIKTLAIEPDSVQFNEVKISKSELSQRDLEAGYSRRFGDKTVDAANKRYFDILYGEGKNIPTKYWVDIDYTAEAPAGKSRSSVLCTYINIKKHDLFLSSLSTNKREYFGDGLISLFMGKALPSQMDSLFSIK